ncbi:hypothetical protein LSCM1_07187 [Leishmania martiniquensis]|uniref:Ubiquitin-like domain-containing protein n=1 Tax=Leishmania martiniquensis TaxID=1580590 RepID=A0A836HKG9_9TRYP|nr:hypothetical protein LSCM1_07187 [Leishmania martiniquensis]
MENQDHSNPHPEGSTANAAPAPVKAEAAASLSAQQISLKVVNADGAEMFFKIKRGTQLKKLIDAYCKKQGISRGSVRFLFDGAPIDDSKTPEDLGMEDDDVIDAMVEQTGGSVMRHL